MQTTYVNRANTNAKVIEKANERFNADRQRGELTLFSQAHQKSKIRNYMRLVQAPMEDPARQITFNSNLQPIDFPNKRAGRPKLAILAAQFSSYCV